MLTTGPMFQVGWASASATVTSSSCWEVRPRNGPPDAVITSRATSSGSPPRRHWAIAECSESTGTICPGSAALVTSDPPATSDSLLARASVVPAASAASVGASPIEPVIAFRTTSAGVPITRSTAEPGPVNTRLRAMPSGIVPARHRDPGLWVGGRLPGQQLGP